MSSYTTLDPQLRQAVAFHQKGMLAEAEQIYVKMINAQPFSAQPRHMLGALRQAQGRNTEALELIESALRLDANDAFIHANHGNTLKRLQRPAEALDSFARAIALAPDMVEAHYNHALLLQEMGYLQDALEGYDRALEIQPNFFEALYNRGMLLCDLERQDEALASLDKALRLKPDQAGAWNNRGNVLRNLMRFDEAVASFDRALSLKADFPNAHYNRGNVLLIDLKRNEEAFAAYDRAVSLKPDFVEAWNDRAHALYRLRRFDEALVSYDKALSLRPGFAEAWNHRGHVLFELDRIEDGIESFTRSALLAYGGEHDPLAQSVDPNPVPHAHKQRHDQEQHDYQVAVAGRAADKPGARIAGPAVTRGNVIAAEEWRTKKPQIAVIDNLLTPAALEGMRRFCLEQPMWRKSYPGGYLGAFPEHGFACPLLGQIAQELREAFPGIFHALPLSYMWGFKYDSSLTGINIHADEAAVNVNFWLTPDEANLDPAHGGLVVWDVAAPLDWDFDKFNANTDAMRDFLAKNGATSVTVPYRANRAVIFDSDLFHETDTIHFADGYTNRRINVTMLYGQRERHSGV